MNVETTPAPGNDFEATALVHDSLTRRELAPDVHLVDTGYVTARGVIAAQLDHDVELVGPMMPDASWQSRTKGGYPASAFTIDWDNRQVTCPSGKTSIRWAIEPDRGKIEIRDQWKSRYQARQGIEGTIAQGVKAFGLRRSRYRGMTKTHLQHLLAAAAINLVRLDAWLTGKPLVATRVPASPCVAKMLVHRLNNRLAF